jgi:hypothetical protein
MSALADPSLPSRSASDGGSPGGNRAVFRAKTVFILGAGASCHYGYPTGEELVRLVIAKAKTALIHCKTALEPGSGGLVHRPRIVKRASPERVSTTDMENEWRSAATEFGELIDRLTAAHPLVIDYFLDHNQDLEAVGKFCIAWAIMEAEAIYRRDHRAGMEINYDNDWYRFIIHKLTTGCSYIAEFQQNQVSFITFNYDVSLDYELCRGLSALKRFSQNNTIQTFLGGNRITHVYGRIRQDPFSVPPQFDLQAFGGMVGASRPNQQWVQSVELMDRIYEASLGLNIISPGKAAAITEEIQAARLNISQAKCVYVLGYGFDRANSELLDLPNHLHLARSGKKVMFTNYNNSGVVNKNAARLFDISANELLPEGGRIVGMGAGGCEKSVKNVYNALAFDFDSPEDEVRAG